LILIIGKYSWPIKFYAEFIIFNGCSYMMKPD